MTAIADSPASAVPRVYSWQTPVVIIVAGCLIAMLSFGPRSALGQFLTPMSVDRHWGRDVFSLALAIQNLLWGAGQPFAGALADKFGAIRVLSAGAILYAIGLLLMANATSPAVLNLGAGVLIGFGLAGCSFSLVIGALGKLVPEQWRMLAFGAGTAAGSFGQFLFSPMANGLINGIGWESALVTFAAILLLILPLSLALATRGNADNVAGRHQQSAKEALSEAFGHRSYVLLVLGFFTCGFQLAFITVHLPAYLLDRGLSAADGAWTIAVIGLFNIIGSIMSGWFSGRLPKRYILSFIYFARAVVIALFVALPLSALSVYAFAVTLGLLWLSTVPPTNGIVGQVFGVRYMAMLTGVTFFSHQIGSFLGAWLGGFLFDRLGSYDLVWYLSIALGVVAGLINLPIDEREIKRPAAARPA